MVATPSTMLPLGTIAPKINSLDTTKNQLYSLDGPHGESSLLVCFICNHCPYVVHLLDSLIFNCNRWRERGVKTIFISSNDIIHYPDDSPENMSQLASKYNFPCPYLYDEKQKIAKAYHAACTPDFYLFDSKHQLFYRGRYDESRPGNQITPTGKDLGDAVDSLLNEESSPVEQKPSLGCNIKWKKNNEPEYFSK